MLRWSLVLLMLVGCAPIESCDDIKSTNGQHHEGKTTYIQASMFGHYYVWGELNGKPVQFFIDTGATYVSVPKKIADTVGMKPGNPYTSTTAAGDKKMYHSSIDSIKIGNIKINNVKASINPHGHEDILLGMSFLNMVDFCSFQGTLMLKQVRNDSNE